MQHTNRFNHRTWSILALVVIAVLALAAACSGSGAEQAAAPEPTAVPPTAVPPTEAPATAEIPVVTIEATDSGLNVPEVVPGGIVRIDVTNSGSAPAAVGLLRIKEGHTRQELNEFKAVADANPEAFFGLFELANMIHSVQDVAPGTTSSFHVDLRTGDFILSDDTNPANDLTFFAANEIVGTTEPEAAVTVDMVDFAYAMPDTVPGQGLWEFVNSGDQWHLAALTTYNPDVTPEQLLGLFSEEGGPPPADAPVQVMGGLPPMSPGERVWVEMDLQPGQYQLVCPLPDLTAMVAGEEPMPHLLHGMMHMFTVEN
ncbi:MAG: hypothetical protein KBD86_02085 [Candidatus Promineofilum sp.]|nr:hypothetical protein [Promineifilum sp.]